MVKKTLKRVLAAALTVGSVTAGLALIPGTSGMAATTGNLVVCARGNYPGWGDVQPINDGKGPQPASTAIAFPGGACRDVYYGTEFNTTLTIKVYGFYNNGTEFYIGTKYFNPIYQGLTIDLLGTTTDPYLYAH
jgi:hypothetical protein